MKIPFTAGRMPARPRSTRARHSRCILSVFAFLTIVIASQADVIINEIMYHPLEPWPSSSPFRFTNRTEYIEIYNTSNAVVDLSEYRFDNGVAYEFTPGTTLGPTSYLVICENWDGFTNGYPAVDNVTGPFQGALANGGERITLSKRIGGSWITADTIEYIDKGPADGDGYSLELVHPGFAPLRNHFYAGDWTASTTLSGTPGRVNSVYNPSAPPVAGDVNHDPPIPLPQSSVIISARALARTGLAPSSVVVEYQKNVYPEGAWMTAAMNDLGREGDLTADDGIFSVSIPTNGSSVVMSSGQTLRFRVKVTDGGQSQTIPMSNTAAWGKVKTPFAYYCWFGDDTFTQDACAYPGEYTTYHVLMSEEDRIGPEGLEVRYRGIDEPLLDCTIITATGKILYNSAIRLRGSDSRNSLLGSYRIQFPAGETHDGNNSYNLTYDNALLPYMAMKIFKEMDMEVMDAKLARLWINNTLKRPNHDIYVRWTPFDDDFFDRTYPPTDERGNYYAVTGGAPWHPPVTGKLEWLTPLSMYYSKYNCRTNNPHTAWHSLSNLCWLVNQNASTFAATLTNRVDPENWGKLYAGMICIENKEAGMYAPANVSGDELKMYAEPITGQFHVLPWDMSEMLGSSAYVWTGFSGVPIRNMLDNHPVAPYYIDAILDCIYGPMSEAGLSTIMDGMGSKLSTGTRLSWNSIVASQRAAIIPKIATNFTVLADGQPVTGHSIVGGVTNIGTSYSAEHMDQDVSPGQWVHLGQYDFLASGSDYVELLHTVVPGAAVVADAVMFSNATHTAIVQDSDAGFQKTGAWLSSSTGGYLNGSYFYATRAGTVSARWTPLPSLPAAGSYDVYAWVFRKGTASTPDANYEVVAVVSHATATLTGTAPQNADRILVNGEPARWQLKLNSWTTTNNAALPGDIGEVTVEAIGPYGDLLRTKTFQLIAGRSPQSKSGTVSGNVTWSGDMGIVNVADNVTVSAGSTLTIDPKTLVTFQPGKSITVNGTLRVAGTAQKPVTVCAADGETEWSIQVTGGGSLLDADHLTARGGNISAGSGGRLVLEDCTLRTSQSGSGVVSASGAQSVTLRRCRIEDAVKTSFNTTPTLVDQCLFEDMSVVAIDFLGAASTSSVVRTTIQASESGTGLDGVQFTSSTVGLVSNCLVRALSGKAVSAQSSVATVRNSLIVGCATGIYGSAATLTAMHNTVADGSVGVQGNMSLESMIIWNHASPLVSGPATASYSDIGITGTNTYPGIGNLNRSPLFLDSVSGDYRLRAVSACLGSGGGGTDMGAPFPNGANPLAPSSLSLAPLTNRVTVSWQDNSGDEEQAFEVWRQDTGADWALAGTASANATNYTDWGLLQDTEYAYRVRATHNRGESFFSDPASATTTVQSMLDQLRTYLRITEIMYNPLDGDDHEFIEFLNIGPSTLTLSGAYFAIPAGGSETAIDYTFPTTLLGPGEYLVLVRDATAYTLRYPGKPYYGVYTKKLSNGGEEIVLNDAGGSQILSVDYRDGWYDLTDGQGYSLVMADADGDPNDSLTWRPSSDVHGSPTIADPDPAYGNILFNEVLSHTDFPYEDAIEFLNVGTQAVDITGWYLSDNEDNLQRYQIPAGPAIPPGGFRVFYEGTSFNANTNDPAAFEISSHGETLYLSSATNGYLTGYRTSVSFGAAENPVSFGRYIRSTGNDTFTAMSNLTFGVNNPSTVEQFRQGQGVANSSPRVGPIVINEIMYNPASGGKEFIELRNVTSDPQPLFNVYQTANTWTLGYDDLQDGFSGVGYIFPTNIWLQPAEHILVVSVPPDEFRSLYGLTDPAIQVFGPFEGSLGNGGDNVRLYKPDNQDLDGTVPYILVDRVNYDDNPPWPPEADNGGPSLERRIPGAFGNDATNWIAATIGGTPGSDNNVLGLPAVGFAAVRDSGIESNFTYEVEIRIEPPSASTVTVHYAAIGGTATPGSDYEFMDGVLVFWPYETSRSVSLVIKDDDTPDGEPEETVEIGITNVSSEARYGGNKVFTYTIVDPDAGTSLDPPSISPPGTVDFTNTITVTLTPTVSGGVIYYRKDGLFPDSNDKLYTGPIVLNSSAKISAIQHLGPLNSGDAATASFRYHPGEGIDDPYTFVVPIRSGLDDVEESFRSAILPSGLTASFGDTTGMWGAGFRFLSVPLTADALVTNAYIQFTAEATSNPGDTDVTISGDAADDSAPFDTAPGLNLSTRNHTSHTLPWTIPAWNASERGDPQRTPDLSAILNEIITRPGWVISNDVSFILEYLPSPETRSARMFDSDPLQAAILFVQWTNRPSQSYTITPVADAGGNTMPATPVQVSLGGNTAFAVSADNFFYDITNIAKLAIVGGVTGAPLPVAITNLSSVTVPFVNVTNDWRLHAQFSAPAPAEDWLTAHGLTVEDWGIDTDGDGMTTRDEYEASTDPTNELSAFRVIGISSDGETSTVEWVFGDSGGAATDFMMYRSTDLSQQDGGWQIVETSIPRDGSLTNTWPDPARAAPPVFYEPRLPRTQRYGE